MDSERRANNFELIPAAAVNNLPQIIAWMLKVKECIEECRGNAHLFHLGLEPVQLDKSFKSVTHNVIHKTGST